jgi:hypothetical protein
MKRRNFPPIFDTFAVGSLLVYTHSQRLRVRISPQTPKKLVKLESKADDVIAWARPVSANWRWANHSLDQDGYAQFDVLTLSTQLNHNGFLEDVGRMTVRYYEFWGDCSL